MIKCILSWALVACMMRFSAESVYTLFVEIIWDKDVMSPVEHFVTLLFAVIVIVVVALATMYVTGLWTP